MDIKAIVGCQSLIGVMGSPPHDHANYFSFPSGERCVNMWAENLEALKYQGIIDDYIDVDLYHLNGKSWAIVTDNRVPEEYINNYPCFTGYASPPVELVKFMTEYYNWDYDRAEEYIDPKSYYEKRGGSYDPETGIAKIPVTAKPRKLAPGWTLTVEQDCTYD